ncbi:MAG: hypothetical protein NXI24_00855 [bacterium]|nr:hypothetical protein [bacterium]
MYYQSFEPKKKRGRWLVWLILILGLGAGGAAAYRYGPQLYYSVTGDALVRLEKRTDAFGRQLLAWDGGNDALPGMLAELDEVRRIAKIQERNSPAEADVYFYLGLIDFYELVVRVPLSGPSLMQLTGRGYLPLQKSLESVPEAPIPRLSKRISRNIRKALALDPGLDRRDAAYLMLAYGDLFFTERTDRNLQMILSEFIAGDQVTPALERYRDWIGLALFALSGNKQEIRQLVQQIDAASAVAPAPPVVPAAADDPPPAEAEPAPAAPATRLQLDENIRDLVLCHAHYFARDFLPALRLARTVKYRATAPDILRVEAVRMEAEIFLLQRGPGAACFFFNEAARIGSDDFVSERISAVCDSAPR